GARILGRFVEKPDRAVAESYLADGGYLWNSGIFMGRAGLWLELLARYRRDIEAACQTAYAAGRTDTDFFRVARESFAACPSDSIDYAIMEPLTAESEPLARAVVGVTSPEELKYLRTLMPHVPFLIPGYGAQGGTADDSKYGFLPDGSGAVVNSARGIIYASGKADWQEAAAKATESMAGELKKALA
ncbi:MAG TPA: sugar phosphate nucleotidyltransferase, partial [Candidatus Peribacteria bacterium]|nr:sugar phosphate nucleotidyltransferase [Candidatus Peribacteria bacterium]